MKLTFPQKGVQGLFFLCQFCLLLACNDKPEIQTANLRCELLKNPHGIDCSFPRLSWEISGEVRNIRQTGYYILVASSLEKLNENNGDLWDSKHIKSNKSIHIKYEGKPLSSRMVCFWKVKVVTNQGISKWSEPAQWSMAFMNQEDWKAQWTGLDKSFPSDVLKEKTRLAARYFRKEFQTEKSITKATLYISGLGLYKAYVNGNEIGNQVLAPTPTDYSKSIKYNTFDITKHLIPGKNAMGVVLGNGRFFNMRTIEDKSFPPLPPTQNYGFPKMIVQLEIDFSDGTRKTIISDDTWKVSADGPIVANNEFDGEEYDARKEMPEWTQAGYNDQSWLQAELTESPGGILQAQLNRNIKIMETIRPKSITQVRPGIHLLDMGQNMVGWVSMKVKGNVGDSVILRFAEVTNKDGSLYMANIRNAKVTDIYTLKGSGTEIWEPSFTYHGFRYVEITGYPGTPAVNDFEGKVIYDEMETTGSFETSDPTINQIYRNAYWGIRGNYRGMPTDCPQRDERMGWLGDRAVGSHGESFIFGNHDLYVKWLDDIEQAQSETGSIPDVAPAYWKFYNDNMTWPGAYIIIANMLYEQFGDLDPIVKHYESMKKWMKYMHTKYMQDNLMTKDIYGDWCMPPESPELIHSADPNRKTDGTVLGTTFYYRMLILLERFARLQEKIDDANTFASEAAIIRESYNQKYFNSESGQYSNNTVTANLLSLCYGMVPDGFEEKVFNNIEHKTMTDFNGHVSTGLVGIQWLMRGLSNHGGADMAYKIATNRDYPSWGYMIENGATTIWELWNGNTADPSMNSHNHVMLLGDLIVWFYEDLAGIRNAPGSAGFEKILMHPYTVDGLDYVTAAYHSVQGTIESSWKKDKDTFLWDITIPGNTTATLYIPALNKEHVTESGNKTSLAGGVKFIKMDNSYAVYEVGSGKYSFRVK